MVLLTHYMENIERQEKFTNALNRLCDILSGYDLCWRDIETAPRDETKILVKCENGDKYVAWYEKDAENEFHDGWVYNLEFCGTINLWAICKPIKWMPLTE